MLFSDGLTLVEHIKIFTFDDLLGFVKVFLAFIPGKLWGLFMPGAWVISESPYAARDNGYWLFRYMRTHYPDRPIFYPISSNSPDYCKIKQLGNVVEFGSIKHFLLFWAAKTYVGTTKQHGFPHERVCMLLSVNGLIKQKYVFLNHGFARGYSHIVDGRDTNYALVFAMSELEKEILIKVNHQPSERIQAIGFCRHDNLDETIKEDNLIVFMPTWRTWFDYRHLKDAKQIEQAKHNFETSSYRLHIQEMFDSPRFLSFLEANNLKMVLYLHGYAQSYSDCFSSTSSRISISRKEDEDIQTLLKRASFLITDYSSVIFDYAYMKKPCCYYQFDAEEFSEKQYAESKYFSYANNGFGPVCHTLNEVLQCLEKSYTAGFVMPDPYRTRVESFFPSFGKDHCERTSKLIDGLWE